ncbi:ssDNA-binding protein [Streptococcus phage STP1]|nr:ssDNA-binding protein [Streptococcus phage STP1]ATI19789.1 Erf protein [Streptococcus phage B5]ATI20042.1 ssDNA-binding protein [Streptococcus phage STP1]ATI20084.1 ssDNA-binding protein [Streptococcus phage STP2]
MEEMTFTELQQKMQLEKKKEGTAKYASRHVEDIYNIFKSLKSNWSVIVNYDLVEFSGKTYIKAIATASNKDEKMQAQAFAELSPVPILKTRNGEIKQMNEPQWVGAVQSYAGKYALQALFAIGEEDVDHYEVAEVSLRPNQHSNFISNEQHDLIEKQINELALITGKSAETVANYYLKKYKLNDFHELLVSGFDVVNNDIQAQIDSRKDK